jgi:tRNA modification GTPase
MSDNELIAAIATPFGKGGIAIIRMSGRGAEEALLQIFAPKSISMLPLQSHMLTYGNLLDRGVPIDECMAVIMREPRSYTREDVCELHVHGGFATAQAALCLCLNNGARQAQPGEFTRRAFENGRIDITQAEAVMQMISAESRAYQRAAMRELSGGTSHFIMGIQARLTSMLSALEAATDFPEDINESEMLPVLLLECRNLSDTLYAAADVRSANLTKEGLSVAICGVPNVGKSSLLNALSGEEIAIVSVMPGTTRDLLYGTIEVNGIIVRLYDMAGLRDTEDPVEKMGIERANRRINESDCVLLVLDGSRNLTPYEHNFITNLQDATLILFINKTDLDCVIKESDLLALYPQASIYSGSALQPASLTSLINGIKEMTKITDSFFMTNQRHLSLAKKAAKSLLDAANTLNTAIAPNFSAADMREALWALSEITGDAVDEHVIDQIFNNFCIGK